MPSITRTNGSMDTGTATAMTRTTISAKISSGGVLGDSSVDGTSEASSTNGTSTAPPRIR
jgi:hypothetical protein